MIVYKVTNNVNGKVYVGITTQTLEKRRYQHEHRAKSERGHAFHSALIKYGFDSFTWEVIDTAETIDELFEKEREYIKKFDSYNNGYNSTLGGPCPNEGIKGEASHSYGRKHDAETKRQIALSIAKTRGQINEELAKYIISLIVNTDMTLSAIARRLDITRHVVDNIARGRAWKHLYDEPPIETRKRRRGA